MKVRIKLEAENAGGSANRSQRSNVSDRISNKAAQ